MTSSTIACVRLCSQGHIDGYHSEQRVFFDDATRLILVPRGNKIEAYDLPTGSFLYQTGFLSTASYSEDGFDPRRNRKKWEVEVESMEQYLSVQISLDVKTIAIHRSKQLIQFVDRETGNLFVQGCSNPKRNILGVFFVESAEYDLIMVTDTAVEFYNFTTEKRQALKMVERLRQTIKWFLYTFATRVLLLGTGQNGGRVTGYQFTVSQMLKLPFTDMDPTPLPVIDSESLLITGTKKPTSTFNGRDIVPLRLYNRVFFCHIDRNKKKLRFYLIFMDVMMLAREYDMVNDVLHFNVVDNVLLVHHTNSSVVAMYDLASPSNLPIGSPLPISGETFKKTDRDSPSSSTELMSLSTPTRLQNVKSFNEEWRFFQPDLVIDDMGNIYRFQLDLEGIVASYSNPAPLIGFLNRRRVSWVPSAHPRTLLVSSLRSVIRHHHSLEVMRDVFIMLHYDGSENVYPSDTDKMTPAALKLLSPMLKPVDVVADVFRYLFNEDVVAMQHLEMCLVEYMKCADRKKIAFDASVYVFWVDLLVKQKKFFQLQQLLGTLKEAQIVAVGQHLCHRYSGKYIDLGLEAFAACAVRENRWNDPDAMHLYCEALLKHGRVIKAMRVAQRHRTTSMKANQFMEAALATKNDEVIVAVKRFITEQNVV